MTRPDLDLVIFDVDGTLVDSRALIVDTMTAAFGLAGISPPTPDQTGVIIGLTLGEGIERLLPPAEKYRFREVEALYRQIYFETRGKPDFSEHLFDGMRDILDALTADGPPMAIATGKSRRGTVSFLDSFGLDGRFVCVRTPDDGPGKPHPSMIHEALKAVCADPARTVMIGDASYDMEMAVSAGVVGLGVAWGNHAPDILKAAGAWTVAQTPGDLWTLLVDRPWLTPS